MKYEELMRNMKKYVYLQIPYFFLITKEKMIQRVYEPEFKDLLKFL